MQLNYAPKILGIVAEYNPFHSGHLYQINKAKSICAADYVVVIMSGHFTQRGEAAIYDPYLRTEMALKAGVDAVYEMPAAFSTASAADFAFYAVTFLTLLNVDYISFGVEDATLDELENLADILLNESEGFKNLIKEKLSKGYTYPLARKEAFLNELKNFRNFDETGIKSLLSTPNNILGLEYIYTIKKIGSHLRPVLIKRKGSDYHDKCIAYNKEHSSATALRKYLSLHSELKELESSLMPSSIEIIKKSKPLFADDFRGSISRKLYDLLYNDVDLSIYSDISPNLSDRIYRLNKNYSDYEAMVVSIKSKDYTFTRISRALCHILLNIKKSDTDIYKNNIKYSKLLGFRRSSGNLLKLIKTRSKLINITKPADAKDILRDEKETYRLFMSEVYASYIYNSVYYDKYKTELKNSYSREIVIV
jgi:UPF0348 protein clos_1446